MEITNQYFVISFVPLATSSSRRDEIRRAIAGLGTVDFDKTDEFNTEIRLRTYDLNTAIAVINWLKSKSEL